MSRSAPDYTTLSSDDPIITQTSFTDSIDSSTRPFCCSMCSCCSCCSVTLCVSVLVFFGISLVVVGVCLPMFISKYVETQICEELCVPNADAEEWKVNNWLSNYNESAHPPEYFQFYAYNVTNAVEMFGGAKAVVTQLGPYTYRYYKEKFNVNRVADNSKIGFEVRQEFFFVPELSGEGLKETDLIVNINLPFLSGMQFSFWESGCLIPSLLSSCPSQPIGHYATESCLFSYMDIRSLIFEQNPNAAIKVANLFLYGRNQLDPDFQFFSNQSTIEQARNYDVSGHNYGMGASCVRIPAPTAWPDSTNLQCAEPGVNSTTTLWWEYTGQTDLSKLGQVIAYLGNTSINIWNGPEEVRGADKFNFPPFSVGKSSSPSIWDELLYRNVPLTYTEESSVLGIDALTFYADPSLFSGTDAHYNYQGQNIPQGLLNVSSLSIIRYGTPSSLFASAPFFYNSDPAVNNSVNCTNCPTAAEMSASDYSSKLYIEPNTGAVVQGRMVGQINSHIGFPVLFNNTCGVASGDPPVNVYNQFQEAYIPYIWFAYSANLTQTVADKVKPSIDQLKLALLISKIIQYGFPTLGSLLLVAAIYIYWIRNCASNNRVGSLNGDLYGPVRS